MTIQAKNQIKHYERVLESLASRLAKGKISREEYEVLKKDVKQRIKEIRGGKY